MTELFIVALVLSAPREPVAMVLQVNKSAGWQREKTTQPLLDGELLLADDRIKVAEGGEVVVIYLHDGHRERLRPGKEVRVGPRGCDPAEAVPEAPRPPPVQMRALREHLEALHGLGGRAAGASLRGSGDRPKQVPVVRPMFGARVLTNHPALAWPAVAGAELYEVILTTGGQGLEAQELWRAVTREPTLPYPEEEKVLDMKAIYRWRVKARLPGKGWQLVFESKFFTAQESHLADLQQVRRLADSANPGDWLLGAALYEARGVYDKALPLYEKLAQRSPRVVHFQLALATYYRQAGRPDKASEAEKRSKELGWKAPVP